MFYDGTLFGEQLLLRELTRENIDNFKYACLHSKSVLYENASIQIGVLSTITFNENTRTAVSNIQLHFINKKTAPINIAFTFASTSGK